MLPVLAAALAFSALAAPTPASALQGEVLFERDTNGNDCYRIPAIVETKQGTLLAFAEARRDVGDAWCDDAGDIDLVVRRSTDGGATWDPELTVASGEPDDPDAPATRGNPVPIVVDGGEHDGRIVLLSTHNPAGASTPRTPYVQYSTFEQDGTEWSEPVSLEDAIDDPDWGWYATGPVHGIQLQNGAHAGRLVAGINAGTPDGHVAGLVYSDDGGTTWQRGGIQPGVDGTVVPQEISPVELSDGNVYLAARNNGEGADWPRAYAISEDGGDTLTGPFQPVPDLAATPRVQGSTVRLSDDRILLATPVHDTLRKNMTVYTSTDDAQTWQDPVTITEDRSGYSDLVELSDGNVGLLYEAGEYTDTGDARDEIRFTFVP